MSREDPDFPELLGGPVWTFRTLRRKGLSSSTGNGTRRNEIRKQQEIPRVDSERDFLALRCLNT